MNEWPDAQTVNVFLRRVARRLSWIGALRGAAFGLAAALLMLIVVPWRDPIIMSAIAVTGAALGVGVALLHLRRGRSVAARFEERAPQSRNVVLTAAELIAQSRPIDTYVGRAVLRQAARVVDGVEPRRLFPARAAIITLAGSAAAWMMALVVIMTGAAPTGLPALTATSTDAPSIGDVELVVTPPAYSGREPQRLRDPQRIAALAGSTIEVTVRARADVVRLETLTGARAMTADGNGRFQSSFIADADGFLALEPRNDANAAGLRRLIGLTVTPDELPRVRITAPGKDLLLPNGTAAVDITLDATDDLGLASLRMTYTRVSGFGEQFTFTEGDVPLQLTREDAQSWTGTTRWQLPALQLEPGDMIVYRARATDRRPGAQAAESETYMIEVVVPNAAVSAGVAMDDEFDRYALSQQMIIVLTERLMARRASLDATEFAAEAQTLAASQRRVRAEFVFMLGGELEAEAQVEQVELHEETHIRADADMAEGRLANLGRIELSRAVQSMSVAAAALSRVEMAAALTAERQALLHVQRAFARTRYILRALNERERIDLSRRLSGMLAGAGFDTRPVSAPAIDPQLATLRRTIADIAALSARDASSAAGADALVLAQRVLRVDPSSEPLRKVTDALTLAATALADGAPTDARARLDEALAGIAALLRAQLPTAPLQHALPASQLDGAIVDALRNRSSR